MHRRRNDLSAFIKNDGGIIGQQTDELLSIQVRHRRPRQRPLAYEVRLALADYPGEADIVRRNRAVELLADHDVTLLRTQHMHRFGAIGHDGIPRACLMDRFPNSTTVVGRHVYLVAKFAGEANAKQTHRYASDHPVAQAHMRCCGTRQVDSVD